MKALALLAPVLAACAATATNAPPVVPHDNVYSAIYNEDAATLLPILIDATRAQNYRVALVEPDENRTAFVVVPIDDSVDHTALVVHVSGAHGSRTDQFSSCFGSCRTSIAVTPFAFDAAHNALKSDHVPEVAQARARDLLAALESRMSASRTPH